MSNSSRPANASWLFLFKMAALLALTAGAIWRCNSASARPEGAFLERPTGAEASPEALPLAEVLADFDQYFAQAMAAGGPPGAAVVIVKDSAVVFCKGYGARSAGSLDAVDAHTIFRIGSLSKGFAGVLTGKLVEEKRLAWNDAVVRYFPEFQLRDPAQARRTQVAHLLSHSTGLPYQAFTSLIEQGMSLRDMAAWLPKAGVFGKEGEIFRYQNIAFALIEEVLGGATGQAYEQLLTEKIFRPAGMADASLTFEGIAQAANKALPHRRTAAGWAAGSITPYYYNTAPAGGVNASAADMGAWLRLLLGHRPEVVADSTLARVFAPRIRTEDERHYFGEWPGPKTAHYALGWRVLACGSDTLVCHGGFVNNYKSEIALDRRAGVGICVLFNGNSPMAGHCIPAFFERYRRAAR